MNLSRLASAVVISALLGTGAFAQDRPDLMDVSVSSQGTGGSAPLADDGKGKPLNGSRNRIESAVLDYQTYASVSGVLTGMVPETANGGVTVQVLWFTNEPDRVGRSGKSGKIDQKAFLAFAARILTVDGYPAYSTGLSEYLSFGYDAVEDCSAKFSAKGVPTAVGADAPKPASAKWSAKCKQSTLSSILGAIGVPAAQQSTIITGLGLDGADKFSVKGGF